MILSADECACIASNGKQNHYYTHRMYLILKLYNIIVNVGLNFVEDASGSITGIEVNCSQDYYINKIIVEVDILKEGININGAKNIFCMIASQFIPIDDTTLECDQSYDLVAYWISKNATKCNLHMVSQQTTPCQGKYIIIIPINIIVKLQISYRKQYHNKEVDHNFMLCSIFNNTNINFFSISFNFVH